MPGERPPVHERQPFCVQCGLVDKIDHDDGACGYCGGDTCGLDQLRTLLAAHDLHVVSPADKAVLDATINSLREFPDSDLAGLHEDDMCGLYKAELARRAATEKG